MKTFFSLIIILSSFNSILASENKIIGVWLTQDNDSRVEITKNEDGTFSGKIIWLKNPKRKDGSLKLDDKNPNEELRSRKIIGLEILNDFKYDKDDEEWNSGTIYDPKSGNTYKCYMWFDDSGDILNVKGYVGFSLIGRTVSWIRVE